MMVAALAANGYNKVTGGVTVKDKIKRELLDLLFPPRCPVCREILTREDGMVHVKCMTKLKYVSEPVCLRCGKPIENAQEEYCYDCQKHRHYFDGGRAVWIYEQHMRQSIVWYKYKHCKEFSDFYSAQMIQKLGSWMQALHPDAVIPVPLNKKKMRIRGYNQAEPIARYLAEYTGCRLDVHTLIRSRWTAPQKDLSPTERFNNLKKAFSVDQKAAAGYRRILLVDDIYTTGSTMDACAHQLKEAGVGEIFFVTMCIGSERN